MRRQPKARAGFTVRCVAEEMGFWLEISSSRKVKYRLRYFALGASGHQQEGELVGAASKKFFRRFVELKFSTIVVGVTYLTISFGRYSGGHYGPPIFPMRIEPSRSLPGVNVKGLGRIVVPPSARKNRGASSLGTYGGAYGMYGTHMYGQEVGPGPGKKKRIGRRKGKRPVRKANRPKRK